MSSPGSVVIIGESPDQKQQKENTGNSKNPVQFKNVIVSFLLVQWLSYIFKKNSGIAMMYLRLIIHLRYILIGNATILSIKKINTPYLKFPIDW